MSNNPTGNNQHQKIPAASPEMAHFFQELKNQGKTTNGIIEELACLGIHWGKKTVERRMKQCQTFTSRNSNVTADELELWVRHITRNDILHRRGPRGIHQEIQRQGVHATRADVIATVHRIQPEEASNNRHPMIGTNPLQRGVLTSAGPGEQYSADGHDKISNIGFPIYGIVDKFSRYSVVLVVCPSNRRKEIVGRIYIEMVRKFGHIPRCLTTDRGSEVGSMAPIQIALRDHLAPELANAGDDAHRFLKSTKNITIEKSWRQLRENLCDGIRIRFEAGGNVGYNVNNTIHRSIALFLWFPLVQADLDDYRQRSNTHVIRFQKNTSLPSGGQPHEFFHHPEQFRGTDQHIRVPENVLADVEDLDADGKTYAEIMSPVSTHARNLLQHAVALLGFNGLTNYENVWEHWAGLVAHLLDTHTVADLVELFKEDPVGAIPPEAGAGDV